MSIQSAQSLHPGGKYYPQDNKQQQMSRPASQERNARITSDDHSEFDTAGGPATLHTQNNHPLVQP